MEANQRIELEEQPMKKTTEYTVGVFIYNLTLVTEYSHITFFDATGATSTEIEDISFFDELEEAQALAIELVAKGHENPVVIPITVSSEFADINYDSIP